MKKPKKRMRELEELLRYHSDLYYNKDNPQISDYEYDALMEELKQLELEYPKYKSSTSPTNVVGGVASSTAGALVRHKHPMMSMRDVFRKEDVLTYISQVQEKFGKENVEFVVETKIDGLSVTLRYKNGHLVLAETRGDGIEFGEDITNNVLEIYDVKPILYSDTYEIPEYLELRGEVYMTKKAFNKANKKQIENQKPLFKNARNCAAGTLRNLDPEVVRDRNLSMFVFNVQEDSDNLYSNHADYMEFLRNIGVVTVPYLFLCKTGKEVMDAIDNIEKIRSRLPYNIDGAVIKVNKIKYRKALGDTGKDHKWLIAYKYPPEEHTSIIRDIELTIGKTGKITPIAVFDPVEIDGSLITKATLHNQNMINLLNVNIGDVVSIYKSGDIIPKIKKVVKKKTKYPYQIPDNCPYCGAPIEKVSDKECYCVNRHCKERIISYLSYFTGKSGLDIKGFGIERVRLFVNELNMKSVVDIYRLTDESLQKVLSGEKERKNLLDSIEKSKSSSPDKVLSALSIPGIGKQTAKILLNTFESIDDIMNASVDELSMIKGIGYNSALSIVEYFRKKKHVNMILKLKEYGFDF